YNPNPVPLPLKNVLTTIYMNDIMMGNGSAVKSEIDTNSNSTIVISTDIQNDRISEWWISHIKNDEESSMVMKGDLVFDLKVTEFKYPIEKTRQVNTDILSGLSVSSQRVDSTGPGSITIESAESQWGEVNHDYTQVVTTVKVQNDYPVDISIEEVNYVVEMNGIRLAEDTSDVTRVIEANSEAELSLTTKMMNDKLEEWWVTHIENNESSTLNTTVQAVVEAEDQRFELNLLEQRSQFTTSLLG
ncbi:MAG: LEA type 2 family protein, partial [Candidatus Hadarchaeota archaeon]